MAARNNEDRTGARAAAPPPPVMEKPGSTENAFSFAMPTEIVELPSRGKYYSDDHPLYGVDSIEIRYMTAKDEDILTSRSLLRKGIAIERMLQNIVVDKSINIDDLLIGDKNALIVAARITGYGSQYDTKIGCPACASVVNYTFDLSDRNLDYGSEVENHEASETENGTFLIDLPISKVKLELRLLTSTDEKKLMDLTEKRRKHNLPDAVLTDQFGLMIVSVNGDSSPNTINSFIEVMPALDSHQVRNTYAAVMPNVNLNQQFTCSACGHKEEVDLPFTADFFWPK